MLVVYEVQKKTQFFSSYHFTDSNMPFNGEIFAILVKELRLGKIGQTGVNEK